MSETVHYKGVLAPTGKTLSEFDPEADSIYDHYEDAVEIDGLIYTVDKKSIDLDFEIFQSKKSNDGAIHFETRYYNGGCGFNEAIENALENQEKHWEDMEIARVVSSLREGASKLRSDLKHANQAIDDLQAAYDTAIQNYMDTLANISTALEMIDGGECDPAKIREVMA